MNPYQHQRCTDDTVQLLDLTRKLCYCKDDRAMRAIDREPLRTYGHSKLSESKIAPLDRRPRKPHPITKHKVDRTTGYKDMAI